MIEILSIKVNCFSQLSACDVLIWFADSDCLHIFRGILPTKLLSAKLYVVLKSCSIFCPPCCSSAVYILFYFLRDLFPNSSSNMSYFCSIFFFVGYFVRFQLPVTVRFLVFVFVAFQTVALHFSVKILSRHIVERPILHNFSLHESLFDGEFDSDSFFNAGHSRSFEVSSVWQIIL